MKNLQKNLLFICCIFFSLFIFVDSQANPNDGISTPDLTINIEAIEDELLVGDVEQYPITVSNDGDDVLLYRIITDLVDDQERDDNTRSARSVNDNDVFGPERDNIGDVIATHNLPYERPHGLSWDRDHNWMWVCNYFRPSNIYAFNPENNDISAEFEVGARIGGVLYLNGIIYSRLLGDEENTIFCWDTEGNALDPLVFDFNIPTGFLTTDGHHIISAVGWIDLDNWRVQVLDPNTREEIARIDMRGVTTRSRIRGIEWVNDHRNGQLWLISDGGVLFQSTIDEDWNSRWVQEIDTELNAGVVTIAHDRENLWIARLDNRELVVLDDGIADPYWIYCEPSFGDIAPGDEVEVTITLDCRRLLGGEYMADLLFISNNQQEPDVVVSIAVDVTGFPTIEANWSQECGYPNLVDWNRVHDNLYVNNSYRMFVDLVNTGTDLLVVDEIFTDIEYFTTDREDGVEIEPGESANLLIIFEAPEDDPGDYESVLTIISNDPDNVEFEILLHAHVLLPPQISIDRQGIDEEFNIGSVEEFPIAVSNEGEAPLIFQIRCDQLEEPDLDRTQRSVRQVTESHLVGPCRDDAGDVLNQYQALYDKNMGLAYDDANNLIWGLNHFNPPHLMAMDPESGERVRLFDTPVNSCGLVYLEGVLIFNGTNNDGRVICRYDTDGNQLQSIESPIDLDNTFIATDGQHLFLNCFDDSEINVFNLEDMEFVATMNFAEATDEAQIWGFEWVTSHRNGPLWLAGVDRYYQCNVDIEWNVNLVQDFEVPRGGRGNSGIAHDGEDLWRAVYRGPSIWFEIDDGIDEFKWVSYDPEAGEISGGEQMEVTITINCERLLLGEYHADIVFMSNDPEDPETHVNISIDVVAAPDMVVEWSREFGFPNRINWNGGHEELYSGIGYDLAVRISNIGTELLIIEDIVSDHEYFTINFEDELEIEDNEFTELIFSFEAPLNEPGETESVLTIFSNDQDEEEFEILVVANTIMPPEIEIGADRIDDVLEERDVSEHIISISNVGNSTLNYSVRHEVTAVPERDINLRDIRSVEPNTTIGPRRDDAGDVVTVHNVDRVETNGLSWDKDHNWMWISDHHRSSIKAFDPESGEIVVDFETDWPNGGLLYKDGVIHSGYWGGNMDTTIFRWDIEGNSLDPISFDFPIEQGFMTTDGDYLISASGWRDIDDWRLHVYDTEILEEVALIDAREITQRAAILGIVWVNEHPDGQLWMVSEGGRVFQCSVDDDWNCELVQDFTTGLHDRAVSIAHDGENLWIGRVRHEELVVIDDGTPEIIWIRYGPTEGTLEAGEEDEISITLNATGADDGDYEADLHIQSNDPVNSDLVIPVSMHVGINREILNLQLNRGWNMNSINITPTEEFWIREEGPDVIRMTEQLRIDEDTHAIELLKTETGHFYAPHFNNFCNIPYWNLEQGVKVKIDTEIEQEIIELEWTGVPIPADAPFNINPGWHIIAYYPEYELDAAQPDFYVLSPIIDFVNMAKNNSGQFMSPGFNFSNMEPWREGQGYQIKIDHHEPVVLQYPPEQQEVAFSLNEKQSDNFSNTQPTGSNMSVLITAINSTGLTSGKIEAIDLNDTVVGSGIIENGRCGLAVWGDDITTESKDGLQNGEPFKMRYTGFEGKESLDLNTDLIHTGPGLMFQADGFTVLEVSGRTEVPSNYYLADSYPNPFNSVTRIAFGVPETSRITLSIFDVQGRLVAELINSGIIAGHHTTSWNASNASAGIYLVRLEAADFTATQKVMLVK